MLQILNGGFTKYLPLCIVKVPLINRPNSQFSEPLLKIARLLYNVKLYLSLMSFISKLAIQSYKPMF